jgi:hypothetical protein
LGQDERFIQKKSCSIEQDVKKSPTFIILKIHCMQAKEKIVYYTALNENVREPLAVIEEFCDWSDKETVKKDMWNWLMAAMSAKYAGYEEAGKRWELLFLYKRLEGLVDAAYGIGERGY